MREIDEADWGADLAHRRERGIGAYARIFDVPGSRAMEAVQRVAGSVSPRSALVKP